MPDRNWMHSDDETNRAKEDAWRALAGDRLPQRAWYYASLFSDDALDSVFASELRDVFWDPRKKERVRLLIDVKIDSSADLPGVPVLRVDLPDRLVTSFTIRGATFVLYRAMRVEMDGLLDFGRDWDRLSAAVSNASRSMTVVGDAYAMGDAFEAPPPLALLHDAESRAPVDRAPVSPGCRPPPRLKSVRRPILISENQPTIAPEISSVVSSESIAVPLPVARMAPPRMTRSADPWQTFGVETNPNETTKLPHSPLLIRNESRPRPAAPIKQITMRKRRSPLVLSLIVVVLLLAVVGIIVVYFLK